jgi:hypothetical protein
MNSASLFMRILSITIRQYFPILFCIVLSAFFVYYPITDPDIFWHCAAGKEIIARKHFLFTDPFAYTLAFPRWIDLHWLFQLICYGLYSIGSERALIIFKLLSVGVTAALLCLTHRNRRYLYLCAILAPFLFFQVRYLVDMRPLLVTMLFTATYVFLFERARLTGKSLQLWWCVPLQIIWTNCQGLYLVGLFIIGAYWFESVSGFLRNKNARPAMLTAVLAACAASCLVNPYGISGLLLPFKLFLRITPDAGNIYSMNISENVPLFSLAGFETAYRSVVIITAVITGALFILNRKNVRLSHVILFAGFLFLACVAVRNVPLYIVAVIPIIGHYLSTAAFWNRINALRPATYMCALIMLAVPVFRHAKVTALYPPHCTLSPFRFPEKITGIIKRNPVAGNMFNDIRYGGYLIWRLYPEKKVFIDTRLVIRSPEFFAEYLAISDRPVLFANVAEKFNITHVILPSALFTRHMKLIKWLYYSGAWRLEYADGASVLFVRNDIVHDQPIDLSNDKTISAIMDSIKTQWSGSPELQREGLRFFSDLLDSLGLHKAQHG